MVPAFAKVSLAPFKVAILSVSSVIAYVTSALVLPPSAFSVSSSPYVALLAFLNANASCAVLALIVSVPATGLTVYFVLSAVAVTLIATLPAVVLLGVDAYFNATLVSSSLPTSPVTV